MTNDEVFKIDIPVLQQKHAHKLRQRRVNTRSPKTADLISTIIKRIQAMGGYAVRINVAGIWDDKAQRWRRSSTEPGTADIHACYRGRHLSIEVKTGDDEQSDKQRDIQRRVQESGGIYRIISDYQDFHYWFSNL